jgi:hypothetical protein
MKFATSTPDLIADAMMAALKWWSQFNPVESHGGRVWRAHARQFDLVELDRF